MSTSALITHSPELPTHGHKCQFYVFSEYTKGASISPQGNIELTF